MIEPLHDLLAIVAGVLLALVVVASARRWVFRESRVYAVGLLVAALVYATSAGLRAPGMLPIEWLGVALFGAIAFVGLHRRVLLAIGWALHVTWDLLIPGHHAGVLVPAWYPMLCVGFDLALAAYLLQSGRH